MPVDIRLTYLDGTTETHARLDLGEPASGVLRQPLQKLDGEGWWRTFRDSGTVDAEGFAVFEEDPTIPRMRNSAPRTLEGTVLDDHGVPLASADVAIIDRRDGKILGQASTNDAGHFQLTAATTKDCVSHHYVITAGNGVSCDLIDAAVVKETEEAKMVELRVGS
ncbi:MAG: carboxypeptidase-like regulatory domain-containing protein [Vicinamibacterales bacterium]